MSRPLDFEALLTTRDFEQGIRNIENQIRNLTQQTERETSQMDSLFRNLATGIGAYFSVQALQGFTQQLINVRGEFQKTEIAFATMLGSQEKAQNLMAEMVDLAAKTPFGLQEISEGAKRLLAFQIPAEEVVDTLTRMGDVAAGLGVPMGQLIHVYGQVKAQGKLMTNDLYQFMNAGIPILSELGSVLGKTEAEVKEMVGQGKIGFSEIQQVIQNMTNEGGLFFNLMEKQSASLSGQIANLQDALDQMFNKIGQANEGILSNGIQAVTYLVENYQKVGVILAGLVSTYGAYKTAVLTQIAVMKIANTYGMYDVATRHLQISATLKQIALQTKLNTVMMANPYAIAIGAVVGLIAVLYSLDTSLESIEDKLKNISKQEEENKKQAQGYISILKDESTSILEKAEAYEKLIAIAPETFGNMTKEQIIAMNLKEAHAQLNEELEKGTKISRQKILNETKQELESLLKLKDLNVDDADGKISSRIEELKKGIADIERENKKINEALMSQNASLDEQQKYWQKEEQEIIKVIEAIKKKHPELDLAKAKAGEIPPKIAGIQTAVDGLDFSGLISRLKFVQSQAKNVANALNGAKNTEIQKNKNDYNKADWETQKSNAQKELDELTKKDIGGNKWKELTVKIKEADKALGAYSIREEKVAKAKKPTKAQIDAPIKGSLGALEKELSDLNTKINNKTLINNKELMKSLLAQREKLEKKIKEIKAQMDKNYWQEELSELERQWKVRYQITKHYGEEIAKVQFPNLKGESYFDEIKNRYDTLDKKQSSGTKLSNEEIEQWQKLKEILDNLQGTKDPFTNWKEHLEQTLSGFETFTQKIEYLQTQIENLTPEQKSQGYEAVLREQLANAEKEYQQFYDNFLKEQQTFEEKKIAIEKKYADLSAKAKNDAQKNAIEKAKSNELTDLFFEETQKSDQWAKIFTDMNAVASSNLEKFKTILQEKLKDAKSIEEKAKIGEFIKKIDEQLENRRGLDIPKRFKEIKEDIKAFVTAKKAVTEAQKEYNKAVADFGKNSAEAQKKEQELLNAEQKRTDAQAGLNKKLGDLGNKTSKYAKIGVDAVNDIREAFDDLGVSLDNDFGDTLDKLQQSFEGINKTAEGAAQFASGDYVGGTIKMISGIIKTFSGWFNNDKKKERAIKREKEALDSLKNTYEELSHAIDRVFKAKEYSDQTKLIQNLEQQKIHLQNMIRQEGAKKKSDQGKISDWQNQINQINRSIIDLKDNLVKDVLQTDLSSFATKIGDALVDAFGRGANAAKDLEKVAGDVLKNMLKHQLDLILQKRYSGTLERLFKTTGLNDDGTGTFKGISRQDQERFKEEIKNASQIANSFLEGYKEIFAGIENDNDSLKGAIKGMSEQTADVLVGQFNAIRINTGEIMKYSIFNVETLKSSLQVLNQIEENTRNLYQMRKDISDMNSKISSKGNSLRANGID